MGNKGKTVLPVLILLICGEVHGEVVTKRYTVSGKAHTRSEAIKNGLFTALMEYARELGWSGENEEDFRKRFTPPQEYVIGYKIISSSSEKGEVVITLAVDIDLQFLKEILLKAGFIRKRSILPRIDLILTVEDGCKQWKTEEIIESLQNSIRSQFPEYFREETGEVDYSILLHLKEKEKRFDDISWCLLSSELKVKRGEREIFGKIEEKPFYLFPFESFPEDVSAFIRKSILESIKRVEQNWEDEGDVIKINIRSGWMPPDVVKSMRVLLLQNFPSLFSFRIVKESSEGMEYLAIFNDEKNRKKEIYRKLVETFNSKGWKTKEVTEELIEVFKE